MNNDISEDIQEIARQSLKQVPKSISRPKIAQIANVESGWLWSFQRGITKNPSFVFTVRIYNFLSLNYPRLIEKNTFNNYPENQQLPLL